MSYTPHNWHDGELLRAEDLNHLEQGVLNEQEGQSAYQIAVQNGFEGTESEWLASLQGPPGPSGETGETGQTGPQGEPGAGGESAYQIAVDEGFEGTQAEWLASLQGPPGPQGEPGGVTSFNGRTGVVVPAQGDYTAAMVGARPYYWTPTAEQVGAIPDSVICAFQVLTEEEYNELLDKQDNVLYLIIEE